MKALEAANTAAGGNIRPDSTAYATAQADSKHLSVATSGIPTPMMQQQQMGQPFGTPVQHSFSPAFGYGAPQMQNPSYPQHDGYGNPYGIQPVGMGVGYPVSNIGSTYPQSHSPPPPFYPSGGSYDYGSQYKPPAEVAGDVVHPVAYSPDPRRPSMSMGMSDTQSQATSTTAVTGSHRLDGGTRQGPEQPPAELSSHQAR
jgi:hypothetical protein